MDFDVLNSDEYYHNFEDIKNSVLSNSPLPKYIPKNYTFEKGYIFYDHENFYKQYEDEMTYREYRQQLFKKAKGLNKDYYYKEYKRLDSFKMYNLTYKASEKNEFGYYPSIYIRCKKGKTTVIEDGNREMNPKIISHNGKKYLKRLGAYYTYYYIDDELWTVEFMLGLPEDEAFKIMESIDVGN
ncbi:DUF4367 domain-containing protein [Dethiothermospora halolimnae]|uniref:DUF4367 domain-containing protein n=1 Tax=Dethiothermospora halolimnae TaxID=3114390 RepID=UPI003CCC3FEE